MPTKAQQMKDERLEIRVKPTDKKLLEEAAKACGISVSSFVTMHSLKAAKAEIDSAQITLSKKDMELVAQLLDAPPKANPALKSALDEFRKKYSGKE